jgi:anti-sigma B factor antagonist
MSIAVESYKDQTSVIIHVGKTLDFSNAVTFKEACYDRLHVGARRFILDFSETGILDSTGLGAIFSLYREVTRLKGQVVFASLTSPVRMVIQISRIHRVFPSYATVDAACAAMC